MRKAAWFAVGMVAGALTPAAIAQVNNYKPVTEEMLINPSPDDWLMYSRTYDAQRYSPLKQVNKGNVGQLGLAWTRGLGAGATETIPLVHNGVMYLVVPGAGVEAIDATNGDLLWAYKHKMADAGQAASARTKTIAIYGDMILYTAPDSNVVGLDAKTGEPRWQTKADERGHTSGSLVVDGKVITGGTCAKGLRANCYISAYDALSGKEIWNSTPRRARAIPTRTRGEARPSRGAPHPRGACRAPTIPCASFSTGALRILRPTRGWRAMAASGTRFPPHRHPTSIAIPPSRWIPPPANLPGIINTCPATIGTKITHTSGRFSARPTIPIPSTSNGSTPM